jgi:hypothetical protein
MKKQNSIAMLTLSLLLSSTLLSGCSSSSTQTENTGSADEVTEETGAAQTTAAIEPYGVYAISYAEKEGDTISMNVVLDVLHANISDDFDASLIEFGGDLADAYGIKVDTIDKENNEAEIWVSLDAADLDIDDLDLQTTLILKTGALRDEDGNVLEDVACEQELIYSDTEKTTSIENATYNYLKKSKTYVIRISGAGVSSYDSITNPFTKTVIDNSVSNLVYDFTNATSMSNWRPSVTALDMILLRQNHGNKLPAICLNLNSTDAYNYMKEIADEEHYNLRFVYGDVSSLNFEDKDIYSKIEKMISNGQLTVK